MNQEAVEAMINNSVTTQVNQQKAIIDLSSSKSE
jgi:hypothetical protein